MVQHPTISHRRGRLRECCTVFATSGVLFLCLIGTLLTKQPLYVLGVDDPEAAAKSVFDAAWMYFGGPRLRAGVLFWDRAEQRRRPVGRRPGCRSTARSRTRTTTTASASTSLYNGQVCKWRTAA